MARMLRVLDRLNGMYLDDERLEDQAGEELARRKDFDGVLDVVPVSDPNIFSEAQRYAQIQAVAQRAAMIPGMYNARKVEERILETLKIPDAKELLNPAMEPTEQNAVNENVAASLGRPVTAFPEQDHIAHLKTHIDYLMNPMFGANPLFAPTFIPGILNHLKEHIALWYAAQVFNTSTEAMGGKDLGDALREIGKKDFEGKRALDNMLSVAAGIALEDGKEELAGIPEIIQQAQKLLQQLQPPMQMPQDPRIAIEQKKVDASIQTNQQKLQLEQMKLQAKGQETQAQMQLEQQRMQLEAKLEEVKQQQENMRQQAELQARLAMNADDNRTAMQLAAAEIASGERVAVETGTGINPGT
jgi:hypothetical protein